MVLDQQIAAAKQKNREFSGITRREIGTTWKTASNA